MPRNAADPILDAELVEASPESNGSGLKPQDILQILWRHKGKISFFTLLGLAAAASMLWIIPVGYQSTVSFNVPYVIVERPDGMLADGQVRNLDARGDGLMEGEVFILASQEVAQQLVESVGADRILGPDNKATNATLEATIQIRKSLLVIPAKRSSVITVAYSHPDPAIAQQVVRALDTVYKNRHRQVHDKGMTFEELGRQKDDAKNKLDQLQSQLNLLKSQLGIASLPEAKTAVSLRLEALESERDAAERELEAQKARLAQLEKGLAVSSSVIANTNEPLPEVSATVMASYRNLMGRLESLRNEESRLLGIWTPESELVKNVQRQIEQLDAQKNSMETENPRLVGVVAPTSSATGPIGPDLNVERATLMGLEASLRRVEDQITQQRNRLNELASREAEILNLERERAIQDTNLTYLVREMSRKDYDRNLGNTTAKNIELIDGPTLPSRNLTEVLMKPMAACAFGGLAIGLALAFLIELVLDLRVKRPSEVEGKLGLPLMLTVPRVKGMGKFKLDMNKALPAPKKDTANESPVPILPSLMGEVKEGKAASGKRQAGAEGGGQGAGVGAQESGMVVAGPSADRTSLAPWHASHILKPYFDALRDRLMLYFQLNNMRHKPKLVAVTGCAEGAGATTMAAGLAAALSETGDGNVLLVDMNLGKGAVHPFFRGRPNAAITHALDPEDRQSGQVQDNLFIASINDDGGDTSLPRPIPKRIHTLMPKMRASDYDYIIFDMPPISETSATVALAASMDQVLLVVEGEKTLRPDVKRAHSLLTKYGAKVTGIYNKEKNGGPAWLAES